MLHLDKDTVGSRGLETRSRIAIQFYLFISCFTCLDSHFIHVSLERAHTSFVAELWLDFLILRRTCTGYRPSCFQLSASTGVHLSTKGESLYSITFLSLLYIRVCTMSPCLRRLFILYFTSRTLLYGSVDPTGYYF